MDKIISIAKKVIKIATIVIPVIEGILNITKNDEWLKKGN